MREKKSNEETISEKQLGAVFAERAEALARAVQADDGEGVDLLTFMRGGMSFALELSSVLRVLSPRRLTRIPGAPRRLDRVFYEGGRVISALDPIALFDDGAEDSSAAEPIVLLEAAGARLGIRATSVLGPRRFRTEDLTPPSVALEAAVAACVKGIAQDLTVVLSGASLVRTLSQHSTQEDR